MRILHISDFHLSNDDVNIAKSQKIVDGLIEAPDFVIASPKNLRQRV